jgi:hypothetical protein
MSSLLTFYFPNHRLLFHTKELKINLETEMKKIYYDSTIEEWIELNISPTLKKLEKIVRNADQQLVVNLKFVS